MEYLAQLRTVGAYRRRFRDIDVIFWTVAARLRFRALAALGAAAVPVYLLLVPGLGLADKALLARLSAMGSTVQLAVALAEPLMLTAGIAAGGLVLLALARQVRVRTMAGAAR